MGRYFCKQISLFRLDNRDVQRRNEVTRLVGAWGIKQVWHPHVRTWGLSETNVGYCFEKSVCDIVVTLWPPQWFGAHGIVPPFPLDYVSGVMQKFGKFSENKRMFKSDGHELLFHEHLQFSNRNGYCMDLTDCQQRLLAAFQVSSCRFVSLLCMLHAFFRRGTVPCACFTSNKTFPTSKRLLFWG